MTNLGEELRYNLRAHNYIPEEVHHVVVHDEHGREFYVDVESFLAYADRVAYEACYGLQNIDASLVVVMKDGSWFSRQEYDGSERFLYHLAPSLDVAVEPFDPQKVTLCEGEIYIAPDGRM